MPAISSFRLGDSVFVPVDDQNRIVAVARGGSPLIPATIIGKAYSYFILGWRNQACADALPRAGKGNGEYAPNEADFTFSTTVVSEQFATMVPPTTTTDTLAQAHLGNTVRVFLDAQDRAMDFPTACNLEGTIIGVGSNGRRIIGWKDDQARPENAGARSRSVDIRYIEPEDQYPWSTSMDSGCACLLSKSDPAAATKEVASLKKQVEKLEDDKKRRNIAISEQVEAQFAIQGWTPTSGERVQCRVKGKEGFHKGVLVVYNGPITKRPGYAVVLDEPIAERRRVEHEPFFAECTRLGIVISDSPEDGARAVFADGNANELLGLKPILLAATFKTGDRVSFNGEAGTVMVYTCRLQLVLDKNAWVCGRELPYGILTECDASDLTLLDDQTPFKHLSKAAVVEAPQDTVRKVAETEAITESTATGAAGAVILAGLAIAGSVANAIANAKQETEIVRLAMPPMQTDEIPTQAVEQAGVV